MSSIDYRALTDKMDVTKSSFFDMFTRSLTRASHNDSDEEESPTTDDFYVKGFLKKECSAFVPVSEGVMQRCGCGRLKTQHKQGIEEFPSETWSSGRHTSKKPTDSYGLLSFSEEDQDSQISTKYIRISDNTSIEMVWSLLTKIWGLKLPRLVLSVLGGDDSQNLGSSIKHALEEGLPKIIGAMKVWLLTDATDVALTRIISSSLLHGYHRKREQRVACIGVAPWGCIAWKEQLLGESSNVIYKPENEGETVKKTLCANHTHFLLVDDGSINRFGIEQVLRTSLDAFIACNAIPLINLLIGGGLPACVNIKDNVKASRRIHIVAIKGSGGLADVLAACIDGEKDFNGIRKKVEEHMMLGNDVDNVDKVANAVEEVITRHKTQIIVFDPSGQYGLHHTIFEAARGASKGPEQQHCLNRLQLAVHLDEVEVAINDLQHQHADVKLTNATLYKAIKSGKSTLVQFLLKTGISLRDFVGKDKKMLKQLYCKKLKKGEFFRELMSYPKGKQRDFQLKAIDQKLGHFMDEDYSSEENQSMTPCQELMLWAVFTGMFEMAETFWKHETSRSLENALVLFRLYRSMSKRLKNMDSLKRQALSSQACSFEQRAVELLSLCYAEAPESATEIIAKKIPLWGNQNLISLAAGGMSRNFVSHTCCQLYLKEIWHGKQEVKRKPKKRMMWKKATEEVRCSDETDPKNRGGCVTFCTEILNFLLFVPKGKVVLHMFMYLIFLGCFVYKLLIKNEKARPGLWIYVNIFVAAATIESICEILSIQKRTVGMKGRVWFHSMWKKLEVLSILLFYLGMGLTFKFDHGSRAVLAMALVAWIVKFSQFYRMIHSLGPYLTMVYRMLLHMSSFLWVLLTVVVAFGIFLFSFLYSAESLSWMILFKLLFRPYLLVFGELGISNYSIGKVQTVFGTTKLDTARELIAVFGMCVYILVANVLLLNMLIAVFNNIYEDIKENSEKIWRFDRYHVIMEYNNKPALPPPFSVLFYLFRLSSMICPKRLCHSYDVSPDKDMLLEMESLLQYSMREFLKVDDQKMPYFLEDTLRSINQKIEGNTKALIELNEKIEEKFSKIEKLLIDYHQKIATGPS